MKAFNLVIFIFYSTIFCWIFSINLQVHSSDKSFSNVFYERSDHPTSSSPVPSSTLATKSQTRLNQARIDHQFLPSRLSKTNENHESHQPRKHLFHYTSSSSGTERASRHDKSGIPSSSSDDESESSGQGGKPFLHRQHSVRLPFGPPNLVEEGISEKMKNLMGSTRLGKQKKVGGKRVVRYKDSVINHHDFNKNKKLKEINQEKYSTLSTFSPTIRSSLFPEKKNLNRSNSIKSKKKFSILSRKLYKGESTTDHFSSSSDQSPKKKHKFWGTTSDSSTDSDYVQRSRKQTKGFPDTRASSSSIIRNKKGPTWNLQNLDEKSKLGRSSLNVQSSSLRPKQRSSSIFFISDNEDKTRSSPSSFSSSSGSG